MPSGFKKLQFPLPVPVAQGGTGVTSLNDLQLLSVSDAVYDPSTWDNLTNIAPSKNAVRDKFETLGTISTQNSNNVSITGGSATLTSALITTIDTNIAAAGVTLSGTTLSADGTDINIDINITPKGSGEVNLSKVDIDAGTIDGTSIATSNITVGSGKTLDVSAGTLTLADGQIAASKISGAASVDDIIALAIALGG